MNNGSSKKVLIPEVEFCLREDCIFFKVADEDNRYADYRCTSPEMACTLIKVKRENGCPYSMERIQREPWVQRHLNKIEAKKEERRKSKDRRTKKVKT